MRALIVSLLALPLSPPLAAAAPAPAGAKVEVQPIETAQRVNVRVDGQPFTTYRWDPRLAKPVLFPILTSTGKTITRGWPLDERPDEAKDHPHHFGLWFNYGDVDGVDFWGNSTGVRNAPPSGKHGSVVHKKIEATKSGSGQGELTTVSDWVMPDGRVALVENTRFVFGGGPGRRAIDRIATLTAGAAPVKLSDNKEGMLALRLARSLEHPSRKNQSGTGEYVSSEGKRGDDVWGTRARWLMLTGKLDGQPVTIAILDHPKNPGHPTYWHARGYGLFAANPLGQKSLSKGAQTLDFSLPAGKSARFAYRVLILDKIASPAELEAEDQRFAR
jgi:hypothetical protein